MVTFETLIGEVQDLKKKAKNRRDIDRFGPATGYIQDAMAKLQFYQPPSPLSGDEVNEISMQLADCYGILGGIYRRDALQEKDPKIKQERLDDSFNSYKTGYELEKKSNQPNSYNRLNWLISSILSKPELLQSGGAPNSEQKNLLEELQSAAAAVELQLRTARRRDVWALADLAMIRTLLNQGEPEGNFADFLSEAPPAFVCNSLLSTLIPLSELEIGPKQKLGRAVELIQRATA